MFSSFEDNNSSKRAVDNGYGGKEYELADRGKALRQESVLRAKTKVIT